MANSIIRFKNCRVLRGNQLRYEDLYVRNGKIIDYMLVFYNEKTLPEKSFDCAGNIVSPGFIDIQINGGFGYDFTYHHQTIETAVSDVARRLLPSGVVAFCPTIVTSQADVYARVLPKVKKSRGGKDGAAVLGLHLEGPFIAKEKKGAHNPQYIQQLANGVADLNATYGSDLSSISIVTLAPELDPSGDVTKFLTKNGVVVSMGHSMASFSQALAGAEHGASFVTHLFNAMPPFHHREPGLVGLLSSDRIHPKLRFGIIADGVHTHPEILRFSYQCASQDLVLVTDAVAAMGLEAGKHFIGDMVAVVDGSRAVIEGTETLCGCITPMDCCVRYYWKASGCSVAEALLAASLHPAQALGLTNKGSLEPGCDADFVILDDDLNVLSTWIAGEAVWERS